MFTSIYKYSITILCLFIFLHSQALFADRAYLKNGEMVTGKVLDISASGYIIRSYEGKTHYVLKKDVKQVTFGDDQIDRESTLSTSWIFIGAGVAALLFLSYSVYGSFQINNGSKSFTPYQDIKQSISTQENMDAAYTNLHLGAYLVALIYGASIVKTWFSGPPTQQSSLWPILSDDKNNSNYQADKLSFDFDLMPQTRKKTSLYLGLRSSF